MQPSLYRNVARQLNISVAMENMVSDAFIGVATEILSTGTRSYLGWGRAINPKRYSLWGFLISGHANGPGPNNVILSWKIWDLKSSLPQTKSKSTIFCVAITDCDNRFLVAWRLWYRRCHDLISKKKKKVLTIFFFFCISCHWLRPPKLKMQSTFSLTLRVLHRRVWSGLTWSGRRPSVYVNDKNSSKPVLYTWVWSPFRLCALSYAAVGILSSCLDNGCAFCLDSKSWKTKSFCALWASRVG